MATQEEIAQAILPMFDQLATAVYHEGPYSEAEAAMDAATALMPLVKRAQAEATAQQLRALSEKYVNFGKRETDPMVKVTYDTTAAFMSAEAAHIENEFKEAGDDR